MIRLGLMISRFVIVGGISGCSLLACSFPFKDLIKPAVPEKPPAVTQKQAPSPQRLMQSATPENTPAVTQKQAPSPQRVTQSATPPVVTAKRRPPTPDSQRKQSAQSNADLIKILEPPPAPHRQPPKPPVKGKVSRAGVDKTDDALVKTTCTKIDHKLDRVSFDECWGLRLSQTGYYSVKGTPILQKIFPPKPGSRPLGRVSLIGGIHGNELSSVSIVFKWLQKLKRHHSGLFHWTVIPMMNPDGSLRERSMRVNQNGVDLNRNLPTPDWRRQSQVYWVKHAKRNPSRYPGSSPASEPETQWLLHHIETFKPDVIIAVHSLYDLVDYDAPDRGAAPQHIGILKRNFLGTYPGSLGNYAGLNKGIPVLTLELPHSWALPTASQMNKMWIDLVRWLKRNMRNAKMQRIAKSGQPGNR